MDERALAVKRCVSDIEVADFVALDLEFSGLFLDAAKSGKVLSYEDYFAKCAESVPKFLALQLGICCAQQRKENNGSETDRSGWDLRTHQLDLWPSEHRVFSVDLQSLRFLRSHGFDFNAFLEKAHPYQRLQKSTTSATPAKPLGAAQVMAALRTAQVPLVVHNGLLDLLHLYDKFLGDLPEDFEDFGKAWLEHFPLTFDTRFVAQEGRLQVFKHPGGLSLQTLFTHLRASSSLQLRSPEPTSQGASHSAGYDAYVTAAVFLMEMDAWLRFDRKKSEAPAEAPAEAAAEAPAEAPSQATTLETETVEMAVQPTPAEEDEGWQPARKRARKARAPALSDPSLLENHKICRRFHNKIALVNTSPGFFVMGPPKG